MIVRQLKQLILIFILIYASQLFADPIGEGIFCYDRIEKDAVGVVIIDNSEYELFFAVITTSFGIFSVLPMC